MRYTLFLILFFVPLALADDWEDFTNNLATDLVGRLYEADAQCASIVNQDRLGS